MCLLPKIKGIDMAKEPQMGKPASANPSDDTLRTPSSDQASIAPDAKTVNLGEDATATTPPATATLPTKKPKTLLLTSTALAGADRRKLIELRTQRNQSLQEGNLEKALQQLDAMIAIEPTASRYTRRGMILVKLKRYDEAAEDLSHALAIDPSETRAEEALSKISELTSSNTDKPEEFVTQEDVPSQTQVFLSRQVTQLLSTLPNQTPGTSAQIFAPAEPTVVVKAEQPGAFKEGTRFGPYIVLEKIGQGGMGSVYKGVHAELNQVVAIKILTNDISPEAIHRFQQEAQLAARLQHPNIVTIFNFGVEKDAYYLVMSWVDGVPLNKLLCEQKLLPHQCLELMSQVTAAMAYAHESGVIHRDLKPSNIMIDRFGRAMVLDFGLAKSKQAATDITRSGQILGTPKYMAPEQAAGKLALVDEQTDVYALGVVLYEMLTGQCPFDGDSAYSIIYSILHEEPPLPRKLNNRLHCDLQTLVCKAMAKEKHQRYAGVRELRNDIERYLHGEAILAQPPSATYRCSKWLWRHPTTSALTLLILLLTFGVIGWYQLFFDPKCNLKSMYHHATTDTEKNIILNTLSTQVDAGDRQFWREVLHDGGEQQQTIALRILAELGDSIAIDRLETYLASANEELVQAAIYAAGKEQVRSLIPQIKNFLYPHHDWRVRLVALEALNDMGSDETIPFCIAALTDNYSIREAAKKILLGKRNEAIPQLIKAVAQAQSASSAMIREAWQTVEMMGNEALPTLLEELPRAKAAGQVASQIIILKLIANIRDPKAIEVVIASLQNPDLARKAFWLLQRLQHKYPDNEQIRQAIATHHPDYFLLVEGECFCVLRERLTYKIKLMGGSGRSLTDAKLQVQLPAELQATELLPPAIIQERSLLEWRIAPSATETELLFSFTIPATAVVSSYLDITLAQGGQVIENIHYPMEVIGVAGVHTSSYDTEDPVPLGNNTNYCIEVRNEGNTSLTNIRVVSRVTPELQIYKITLLAPQMLTSKIYFDPKLPSKGVIFVPTLPPGEILRYTVACLASKTGSALHTAAVTYDQFAREIALSEATFIYSRQLGQ